MPRAEQGNGVGRRPGHRSVDVGNGVFCRFSVRAASKAGSRLEAKGVAELGSTGPPRAVRAEQGLVVDCVSFWGPRVD